MNMKRPPLPAWAVAALLAAGIIAISFSALFIRWSDAPASVLAMYRLFLTNLLMLPFAVRRLPALLAVSFRDIGLTVVSGLFLALHFLFWMESLRYTSVASSTVLLSLEPVFVLMGACWIFGERTTGKAVIGMGSAIAGAALIGWGDVSVSARALQGDLLSFLGTAAVAVHMLMGQALSKRMPSFFYSFIVFASAGTAFLLYNLAGGTPITGYSGKEWGLFALLAVVPTVFGHMLFNWLLQYVNAASVSMSVLGEPVGATLLAFLLLGEGVSAVQSAAGLVIIWGVWYFLRHNRVTYREKPAPRPGTETSPQALR